MDEIIVNVATNADYWGDGWIDLTEDEQEEQISRFERLCIKYGATGTNRVDETYSHPNRNDGESAEISDLAWDAWCRGEDAE